MCLPIVISTHTRTNLMLTLFLLCHTHKILQLSYTQLSVSMYMAVYMCVASDRK